MRKITFAYILRCVCLNQLKIYCSLCNYIDVVKLEFETDQIILNFIPTTPIYILPNVLKSIFVN